MDWVVLTALRFDAIVGILAREQVAPQPLELQIRMGLSLDACASSGDLGLSVNYAAVAEEVRFVVQHGRWRLIESMGTALCRLLLVPPAPGEVRAPIDRVELSIAKPTILDGLAVPSVVLFRQADWCQLTSRSIGTGVTVEALEETPDSGAYRIQLAPGGRFEPPAGLALRVVAGQPHCGARLLQPGTELARATGTVENPGDEPVTLLAAGSPWPA